MEWTDVDRIYTQERKCLSNVYLGISGPRRTRKICFGGEEQNELVDVFAVYEDICGGGGGKKTHSKVKTLLQTYNFAIDMIAGH